MQTVTRSLPHDHLFTRLQTSAGKGIGVFAIRDIPVGTNPFQGEASETMLVPAEDVERIEDEDLRRFYFDFCPLIGGLFLAPVDFNRMASAWYMNHSDEPNVACGANATFVAKTLIRKGVELTVDYTAFSEHAGAYARMWRGG